ncbi:MAG TPA: hypothetical protein VGK73_35800, partial [Polyangiaceae bacterium]
ARRRVEHVLPAVPQPDILANALDGYATAQLLLNDEHVAEGPLLSTRDGAPLAERWELVAMADGRNAANRLDSGMALLVDDGDAIVSIPGLRGQYVFRDQRRAFAFREGSGGRAELVFVDLPSGEATGIGEYPSEALDLAQPFGLTFGVSPHERAAYFVLGPDEGAALDAPRRVVRWLDGQVELLEDRVLTPATRPGVADDGTAVFSDTRGSVRFRPGAETLSTPGLLGLMLSSDGRGVVALQGNGETSRLVLTDLDSGVERSLAGDITWFTMGTDLSHARFAAALEVVGGAPAAELRAGRFPTPP